MVHCDGLVLADGSAKLVDPLDANEWQEGQ
jgi:hypothetical protein